MFFSFSLIRVIICSTRSITTVQDVHRLEIATPISDGVAVWGYTILFATDMTITVHPLKTPRHQPRQRPADDTRQEAETG